MIFEEAKIAGVRIIRSERFEDPRGSFARTFCVEEFDRNGLCSAFSQHSMSISTLRHTVRGFHFQRPPHEEIKVVSCVRGEVWDVVVDLRLGSPTYLDWMSVNLSPENGCQLYIPAGCAHGFQSLTAEAAVSYLISVPYAPGSACGIRFDDPAIGVEWPADPSIISERDLGWPLIGDQTTVVFEEAQT